MLKEKGNNNEVNGNKMKISDWLKCCWWILVRFAKGKWIMSACWVILLEQLVFEKNLIYYLRRNSNSMLFLFNISLYFVSIYQRCTLAHTAVLFNIMKHVFNHIFATQKVFSVQEINEKQLKGNEIDKNWYFY